MGMTEKQAMEFVAELIGAQNQVIENLKLENKLALSRLEEEQDKNEILKKINADLQKSYNEVNEKYLKADNYANEQKNRADKLEEENKQALQANDLLGRLNDGIIKDLEKKEKLVELKAETAETTTTAEILTVLKEIHQHLIGGNPVMAANAINAKLSEYPRTIKLINGEEVTVYDIRESKKADQPNPGESFLHYPSFEKGFNMAQKDAEDPTKTYLEVSKSTLYQALGEASSCWENLAGAGVFDSTRCNEIGQRLEKEFLGVPHAIAVLTHHLKTDPEYRRSWVDHLSVVYQDFFFNNGFAIKKEVIKAICDEAAEEFIKNLCQ